MTLVSEARLLWLKKRVSMRLQQVEECSNEDHHSVTMTLQENGSVSHDGTPEESALPGSRRLKALCSCT